MKKRKTGKRGRAAPAKEVAVKIAPEATENTPSYYCNHASINQTRYDFTITLSRLPASLKPEQRQMATSKGVIAVEAALQLVVSPLLVPRLIKALNEARQHYEERFGKIEEGTQHDEA